MSEDEINPLFLAGTGLNTPGIRSQNHFPTNPEARYEKSNSNKVAKEPVLINLIRVMGHFGIAKQTSLPRTERKFR